MTKSLWKSVRDHVASRGMLMVARHFGQTRSVALLTMVLVIAVSQSLTGCGPIQVRAGRMPDISALEKSLRVAKSTQQEVRAVLGNPDGQGRSMLPWQESSRTVWSYYYEEGVIDAGGSNSDDRRIFLFLFFDGDRYDGYMWFSSLKPTH